MNKLEIFNKGRTYLLSFPEISEQILDDHLHGGRTIKNLNDLYFSLLSSLTNRNYMGSIGKIEQYSHVFYEFNPKKVCANYKDYKNLLAELGKPGKRSWVIFCKGAIDGARFLSKFSNLNDFTDYVNLFYKNKHSRVGLPLILEKEIRGFRLALACDFLKESGFKKYVKPDDHIKKMFKGLGFSEEKANDYMVYKDVIKFSYEIKKIPYVVDKLFWLIASGRFYLEKNEKGDELKIDTKISKFLNYLSSDTK